MKIGILTFNYCNNFGATLQAYALCKAMKNVGHYVSFIDYKLEYLTRRYTLFQFYTYAGKSITWKIGKFTKSVFDIPRKLRKRKIFNDFRKQYLPEESVSNASFDCIVVGSDQVWNPNVTGGYDEAYYGIKYKGIKHISYAASCPASAIDESKKNLYANFDTIGVREKKSLDKLHKIGITAYLNIDPTFLLSREEWMELVDNKRIIDNNYLLVYNLSGLKEIIPIAKRFSEEHDWVNTEQKNVFKDAGPKEFVNLFMNAEATIVSSFHGTAFSIICHKPFLFFPNNDERDERVLSLLQSLNLEHCVYSKENGVNMPIIDWKNVDEKLDLLKKTSLSYLLQAIC